MPCIPFELLVSFSEGQGDPAATSSISAHLEAGCVSCQDTVEWLRKVIHAMQMDDSQAPPRESIDRLVRHFKKATRKILRQPLRRLVEATLIFDSRQQLEFSGTRSLQENARQFLYQADHYDIDVRFSASDPRDYTNIMGQILAHDADFDVVSDRAVCLCRRGSPLLSALTDPMGVFHLRQVPDGQYDLRIMLKDCEVAIRNVLIASVSH